MRSFLNLAIGSLAIFLFAGSVLAQEMPKADAVQPATVAASADAAAPAAVPASTQTPAPATPAAEIAAPIATPAAPPTVTYENGQLTVIGNNGTLSDILTAIQQKTGATIESASMSTDRIVGQYGPATPASVIGQLLNGTSLNYAVVRPPDGAPLSKVLLSERPAHVDVQVADDHRGFEEDAASDGGAAYSALQADFANAGYTPRRRRHFTGNTTQADSTDGSSTGDGSNPAVAANGIDGAASIGSSIGSPILPDSVPANIMKAIQHGPGGTSPSSSAANSGMFGPNPGSGSSLPGGSSGGSYTLPNGATMLGPAIQLPGGALFFPGGATSMPGR